MKFIAQFEAIEAEKVIVTYEADGIIKAVETVDKGSKPKNVPENPTKKDHTFMGWQKNGTGVLYEKKAVEALTINEDTDFIANFKEGINVIPGDEPKPPEYVTVTFDKGEGEALLGTHIFHVKKSESVDLTSVAPTAVSAEIGRASCRERV